MSDELFFDSLSVLCFLTIGAMELFARTGELKGGFRYVGGSEKRHGSIRWILFGVAAVFQVIKLGAVADTAWMDWIDKVLLLGLPLAGHLVVERTKVLEKVTWMNRLTKDVVGVGVGALVWGLIALIRHA